MGCKREAGRRSDLPDANTYMQEPWPRQVRSRQLGAVVESACVVKVHVGLKSVGYHVLIVLSALDADDSTLKIHVKRLPHGIPSFC
jgi:hypothetical protein